MTPVERDDFSHALGQTLKFYGKELQPADFSFWMTAMGQRDIADIKRALLAHVREGKYAPKPADIIGLMSTIPAQNALPPPPPAKPCPPEIAKAWMWFIRKTTEGSNFAGIFTVEPVDEETQDRYLHIVNHEAHKYGQPEAIPDEYKLREVWG